MDGADIITALVALYAAILSTIIALHDWRAKRPNIKVDLSMGNLQSWAGDWNGRVLFLEASNPGEKAVILNSMGLILPGDSKVVCTNPQNRVKFPHHLDPEQSCRGWSQAGEIASQLKARGFHSRVKIVGFYNDEVGRIHKSKPFEFDVDDDYAYSGP